MNILKIIKCAALFVLKTAESAAETCLDKTTYIDTYDRISQVWRPMNYNVKEVVIITWRYDEHSVGIVANRYRYNTLDFYEVYVGKQKHTLRDYHLKKCVID